MKTIQIGLMGLGTVGSGVWKLLTERATLLEERVGLQLRIKKILVQNLSKQRKVEVPASLLTTDLQEIVGDPEIGIVVELIGGIAVGSYLTQAIEAGKQVVTANKALLAERGGEIFARARARGVRIGFEASVAGGIPILKVIREGFVGNKIQEVYGIINGTSNFILSEMTEKGTDFAGALRQAQGMGYAESDPKMDIDGRDAAQKLAILISLCCGAEPSVKGIFVEGIERITPFDVEAAKRLGFVPKLLAISKQKSDTIEARVHPTLIPKAHPLADVSGVFNAIYLKGDAVGEAMFYGRGAGMMPTASAVVADIVEVARAIGRGEEPPSTPLSIATFGSMDNLMTEYYLRFSVIDRPGVLAQIAHCLGTNDISISTVFQYEQDKGARVPIIITTHEAKEKNVQKAIQEIDRLESVLDKTVLLRMERL